MKTETELKKTWCPYRRGTQFAAERDCIGFACSQCVDCGAVRETGPSEDMNRPDGEGWLLRGAPANKVWIRDTGEKHAYCGRNVGEALRQELHGMAQSLLNAINNIGFGG